MKIKQNNYAFIDSQNLNLGIKDLGWNLDYKKFRRYLKEKYSVTKAYLFIGYMTENTKMYQSLQEQGYILIFKPILFNGRGEAKGNVDADLVLQAMRDFNKNHFNQSVIVTSDGDFYCLVNYFYKKGKLKTVMSPCVKMCSSLLTKNAKEKIVFMDNLNKKLSYKRKSTA